MPRALITLGLIGRRHPPATRWGEPVLRPHALLTDLPALAPGAVMAEAAGTVTLYVGPVGLHLHSGETAHYLDNLQGGRPAIWVAMDEGAPLLVTADPYEGEALAGDPARLVEALAMPPPVAAALAGFVATHHREAEFVRRKKDRQPDGADPRAPRILPADPRWRQDGP